MRSYGLGISFTMLLAALYAFQNKGEVVVRFLTWERVLPQGVWEIALFALGCVVMWIISLSAIVENRNRFTGIVKDQKTRLTELEEDLSVLRDERKSLMIALKRTGSEFEIPARDECAKGPAKWEQDVRDYVEPSADSSVESCTEEPVLYEESEPRDISCEPCEEDNAEVDEGTDLTLEEELEDEGKVDN